MTIRSIPGAALGGRPVSHAINGFIFTRTTLPAGLRLPRHAHQHATLNIVLGGEYAEATSGSSKCYGPMTVISKPPGAEHANSLGKEGARCLVLELTPARLALMREETCVFEEVRIAPAGSIAADLAAGIAGASAWARGLLDSAAVRP